MSCEVVLFELALISSVFINNNDNPSEWPKSRLLQSPQCTANCLQHIRSSDQDAIVCKSHATLRALITCSMSCATW